MRLVICMLLIAAGSGAGACHRDPAPPAKPSRSARADPSAFGLGPIPELPSGLVNTRADNSAPTQVSPLPPTAAPVEPGRGGAPNDIDITNAVRQAINGDPTLSKAAQMIDVSTSNGVVRLSGLLPTEADKENLRVAVERVAGVRSIDNWVLVRR